MSNGVQTKNVSGNPFDIFVIGARKGFNIAINNLVPNILMAYAVAEILNLLGVMSFLGNVFGPAMTLFGLPGEAVTVVLTAWLSSSASVGLAANMAANGMLDARHITILMPCFFLLGAQLQYMGNLMKFKLRLPSFMKKVIYSMTEKTVSDIFDKNDYKDAGVIKTVVAIRQYDKRLGFSRKWITDFVYQIVMLAKKEPKANVDDGKKK